MTFVPDPPAPGRVFETSRVVRTADVTLAGRLRFDALARYLQDAAEDDVADAGWDEPLGWLLRRVEVVIGGYPARGERLRLRTFCSGLGPRWAERTTTVARPGAVAGSGGDLLQARAVWVAVGLADGRPAPLGEAFHRLYGAAAQGRRVSARLHHTGPPERSGAPGSPGSPGLERGRAWPLRASDFDMAGHVNNSVHWAAVEDVLAGLEPGWLPARAELEYHRPVLPGHEPHLVTGQAPEHLCVWLLEGTQLLASARLIR